MKTIPNLTFTIKAAPDSDKNATTADILRATLAQPPAPTAENPRGGFDFATMRARNRIADVLDKVKRGGEIKLEDADFAAAVQCVKDYRWPSAHPDFLKFAELFGL